MMTGRPAAPVTHRQVLAVAVPMILSNVTTPLIGAVDTAIIGQLGEAHLIGAVAVSAIIFTIVFWAFGFLRMGTTAFTAQASGANRRKEVRATLYRALVIAALIGLVIIAAQAVIAAAAFPLMGASPAVEQAARDYFDIRIWAAPMTLANYALLGWFVGLGRAGTAFGLQLLLNGTNIALDVLFVMGLGLGVPGVALGTAMAETIAAVAGIALAFAPAIAGPKVRLARVFDAAKLRRLFAVNRDIMIRTLCLMFAFSFFTAQGARGGDLVLAANAVLLHFLSISSHFLDGLAFSAEVLTGRAIGARDERRFDDAVRLSSVWAFGLSALLSLFYFIAGGLVIDIMTISPEVRISAREFLFWAALAPVAGVAAFQLDGVFIGATRTQDMRNMMILSLAVYLLAWAILSNAFGNHGLWAAMLVFFVVRALSLMARMPALRHAVFRAPSRPLQARSSG